MAIKGALKLIQSGSNALSSTQAKVAGAAAGLGAAAISVNNLKDEISEGLNSFGSLINNASSGSVGNIINGIVPAIAQSGLLNKSSNTSLTYPTTLNNVTLNPAHITFQFYKQNTKDKLTTIHLPMPDNINNPSTISWDQESFGMIGDTMIKGLKEIQGGSPNAQDVETKLNSMMERVKSLGFYTGMSNVVGKAGGSASAEGIMGAVSGKTMNPYRAMLFRGVDFRSFSFKFDLVPFSESDCDLIHNIVMKFREHSYPDFAAQKMFFTYPDECQITYMWESGPNKWLNNFKRAVCTGIDVDFAPQGQWSSLRNGFPNMIRITTRWSEVEIITKGDIKNADSKGQRS